MKRQLSEEEKEVSRSRMAKINEARLNPE